ncbi:hypothetical protein FV242_25985 [Methylobacterium sp. WL64]|nr:hypothetical protein FV242_25985 [Methylobacterium sp. WL64]
MNSFFFTIPTNCSSKDCGDGLVADCFTRRIIKFSYLSGCVIRHVIQSGSRHVGITDARRVLARCPTCGSTSTAVYIRYERRLVDLPTVGQPITVRLQIRRFCHHYRGRCLVPACDVTDRA